MDKTSVLFACTHNSARSQMAEGLLRDRYGDRYDVYSAGPERTFDVVITVCDAAREACPYLPAEKKNLHRSFEDPSAAEGPREERRAVFRRVRDELADWIDDTFAPESTDA